MCASNEKIHNSRSSAYSASVASGKRKNNNDNSLIEFFDSNDKDKQIINIIIKNQ